MASESITLVTRDKREVQGSAEITRISPASRTLKLVGFVVGGLVLGLPTIFIPGVHFVAPWGLPLMGLIIGGYLYGKTGSVGAVHATCPDCGAAFEAQGGPIGNDEVWVRCTGCKTPLRVVIAQ